MIDVEGGNNMLYVPLDKILEQSGSATARPRTSSEWQDLADQIAPYLPGPSSNSAVDRTRLNSGRGDRP